ncbi:hypothetical protein HMSSN139_54200 [Paenibacillus sp. HMSSN-139]|nr:hypothetical protein HMSSN139_54200 [Paenibacillus sp. HMSSN-139]
MKYRKLGRTGLNVSVVGIGTWQFGGEWGLNYTQAEVDAILDRGRELGINLIDTAECYGDHLSESFIGDYLSRRNREEWLIATKFGHQFHERFTRTDRFDAAAVLQQLDASLKALKTTTSIYTSSTRGRMRRLTMMNCGRCWINKSKRGKSSISARRSAAMTIFIRPKLRPR